MPPTPRPFSASPIDALAREAIQTGRALTDEYVGQLIERMATAPFPTAVPHRDLHVVEGKQWAERTTVDQYADDLRRAVRDPAARLALYVRRGGHLAAIVAETARIVPTERQGANALPLLFVVFSADRGIIVTGYQVSSLERIHLPEDIRWLK